jgi:hypothetical protein
MRKVWMATIPVFAITLTGCGDSNSPAPMPTLTQEQIDAEEKHQQEVAEAETVRAEILPRSQYVTKEEAAVNAAERQREATLKRR